MHPIIGCATDVQTALKGVASVEPTFMSVGEKQSALVALAEARSQLDALTARVLAASDDVGEQHGLRDAAALAVLFEQAYDGGSTLVRKGSLV